MGSQAEVIDDKTRVEELLQDYKLLQGRLTALDESFQVYKSENDLLVAEFTRQLPQL